MNSSLHLCFIVVVLVAKTGTPPPFEIVTFKNKTDFEMVIFTVAPVSCIGSAGICLHYWWQLIDD